MIRRNIKVIDDPSFSQEVYEFGEGYPKIMFTAGIHGNEVTGIYVAERLIEYFSKKPPLLGSIKIMPRCNPIAIRQRSRTAFYDNIDMNRIFPGSEDGSPTLKAANNIWKEAEDMDIVIDLHCCGQHGLPYILAIYDELPEVKELSTKLNMERLIKSEGSDGQLFIELCRERKQKSFVIELPSGHSPGCINVEVAEDCYDALLNLLKYKGIIHGEYVENPPIAYGNIKDIIARDSGLWVPLVDKGENIEKGQVLGELNGKKIIADEEGTILMIVPRSYLFINDYIVFYIQER